MLGLFGREEGLGHQIDISFPDFQRARVRFISLLLSSDS